MANFVTSIPSYGTQVVVPSKNLGASAQDYGRSTLTNPVTDGLKPKRSPRIKNFYQDNLVPKIESLSIDWLEIAFTSDLAWVDEYILYGDFEFKEKTRNMTWRRMYDVYYKGEKFGMLKTNPTSTQAIKANEVHFKMDNSWLYSDFKQPLWMLTHDASLDYSHISRLDVAGDGKNIMHPLNLWLQGKIHRVSAGGSQMTYCKATVNSYAEINTSYHRLGSPESEKFMRVYNKSKELKHSGKQYIINYWKLNGIPDVENMERIELTLRAKFTRQILEVDYKCTTLAQVIELLMDNHFKANIISTYTKGMYEFKLRDKSQKSKCSLSYNLYYAKGLLPSVIRLLSRVQRTITDGIYAVKLAIKNSYQLFVKTGNKKYYHYAKEMAYNFHLSTYFKERRPIWMYEVAHYIKRKIPFLELFQAEKSYHQIRTSEFPIIGKEGMANYIKKQIDHLQMVELNIQ